MSDICHIKNPLRLDGSSQSNRLIPALLPEYVSIDERTLADLLNLACEFSRTLQYYALDDQPDGNWQHFFEHNPCMLITRMNAMDQVQSSDDLNELSDIVLFLAGEFNNWYVNAVPETRFHADLERMISAQLKFELSKSKLLPDGFHAIWGGGVDKAGSGTASLSDLQSARQAFLDGQAQLAEQSEIYLDEALAGLSSHEPHIALLITFFYLLKYAQDELNQMTRRHLDFYYKDVLKFRLNDLQPDKAHVLFESKADDHLVAAGTLLKAGSDAEGNRVLYQTARDIVVNRASVGSLKTVFIDAADHDRIYAAAVANSADGLGAEFETEETKWKTFGEKNKQNAAAAIDAAADSTYAEIGFAIASPTLLLQEGDRHICLELSLTGNISSELSLDDFKVLLTASEGWFEIPAFELSLDHKMIFNITLKLSDPAIIPFDAVLHGDAAVAGDSFDTDQAMVKILLRNAGHAKYAYDILRAVECTQYKLDVTVGSIKPQAEMPGPDMVGVQAVSLSNDSGSLKATKPFYPFTVTPVLGSSLYIGSSEVFQKSLVILTLSIRWKALPSSNLKVWYESYAEPVDNSSFKISSHLLLDQEWKLLDESRALFHASDARQTQVISFDNAPLGSPELTTISLKDQDLGIYTPASSRGFLVLKLTAPNIAFGHADYTALYTTAIIAYANDPSDVNKAAIPHAPYTPEIESLSLHYKASETITLDESSSVDHAQSQFFHIYPFGQKAVDGGGVSLLPRFQYDIAGINYDSQAELYIGILNLKPHQNLSLLFQVAEGSAEPEVASPDISWAYLSENRWLPFQSAEIVSDTSRGLLMSGVMIFDMPSLATSNNSIMASGYHWLRASVGRDSAGVCDLVNVHAQAVEVSFFDQDNGPDFLAQPRPAESINKLLKKDVCIKSIDQPYASFDGRMREQDEQMYVRASERLRHKERAITIWDYEHLVLQAFPDIYKVKCVNHSSWNFQDNDWDIAASEFAPGFVSLIVIPNLKNKNMVNPLEPRVSVGRMTEIKTLLARKISPFAAQALQVLNPMYEPIQVEFAVHFHAGYDWGFYAQQLHEDIISYLSPWVSGDDPDIEFGGIIHKSVILNFIEEQAYVDYVVDYKMHVLDVAGSGSKARMNVEAAIPASARSIFVSAASHHMIETGVC
ncbi:MAG: hypothetical protein Q9M16_03730 [Mariprofundus sp.]|nr:hypothetical protein [Mariprofundus sp.]